MNLATSRITAKTIRDAAASLKVHRGRATMRLLYKGDVWHAVEQHRAAIKRARRKGSFDVVETHITGGFVANSYGYSSQADFFKVITRSGVHHVTATREHTQSRPNGIGTRCITRVDGKIVAKSF